LQQPALAAICIAGNALGTAHLLVPASTPTTMFNRTIRTLYTTARVLAEEADPKAAARSLGFSNVKRTRQLPALDIPTTGGADLFGAGAGPRVRKSVLAPGFRSA
jgi:hypothetical protein